MQQELRKHEGKRNGSWQGDEFTSEIVLQLL